LKFRSPDETLLLEDELLHALSDSVESSSMLKRDAVFAVSTLTINQGSFKLLSSTKPSHDTMEEDEGESKGCVFFQILEFQR
jgi:hypothetical protein